MGPPRAAERLQLVTDDSGPFEVIAERFSGSLAEVEITQLATGVTQRVYHRPPRSSLKPGQRVSLRILATILAVLTCLWQSGCDVLGVPELKVLASESVRIRSMVNGCPPREHSRSARRRSCTVWTIRAGSGLQPGERTDPSMADAGVRCRQA